MKAPVLIFLIATLAIGAILLWSSNSFDQNTWLMPMGNFVRTNSNYGSYGLAMTFAHIDHAKEQCVTCHHNYQDDTGQGLCIECHRTEQKIAFKFRDQFHELCMGCHMDKRAEGEVSGPLRNCKACHTADHKP